MRISFEGEISRLMIGMNEPANLLFLGGGLDPNPQRVPMDQANSNLPQIVGCLKTAEVGHGPHTMTLGCMSVKI
jgi:hypothetical protein